MQCYSSTSSLFFFEAAVKLQCTSLCSLLAVRLETWPCQSSRS